MVLRCAACALRTSPERGLPCLPRAGAGRDPFFQLGIWVLRKSSSRTRVTELPSTPRYRFFFASWHNMEHARFSHWNIFPPTFSPSALSARDLFACLRAAAARRHALTAPPRTGSKLLLPLRGI